jgi:murein DD-endopeptidase MepM/ murein hydrolase activator NlpD
MSRRRIVFDSGVVATVQRNVRSARRAAIAIAGLAVVAAAGYTSIDHSVTPSLAALQIEPTEVPSAQALATTQEVIPPAAELATLHPIPSKKGTPLDELYPSLTDWIHPVVDSDLILSNLPGGMFGAERGGVMRRECGGRRGGHCGIDINGPIGRPIVAVTAGTVVHNERSRDGKDGRSGRYVRIEHPDGVMTSYMHLNSIRPGLKEGMRVDAGDQIGTLGNTGINAASPHLHFALELPNKPGTHGDHVNTRYIDPAPFLSRATMTETVDRSHPAKPAW